MVPVGAAGTTAFVDQAAGTTAFVDQAAGTTAFVDQAAGPVAGGSAWRAITSPYQWALDFGVRRWVA